MHVVEEEQREEHTSLGDTSVNFHVSQKDSDPPTGRGLSLKWRNFLGGILRQVPGKCRCSEHRVLWWLHYLTTSLLRSQIAWGPTRGPVMFLKYHGANNCGFQPWYHLALHTKSTKNVSCASHGMKLLGICLATFSMLHISSLSPHGWFFCPLTTVQMIHLLPLGQYLLCASWSWGHRVKPEAEVFSFSFTHPSPGLMSHTLTSRELCCTFLFLLHYICCE